MFVLKPKLSVCQSEGTKMNVSVCLSASLFVCVSVLQYVGICLRGRIFYNLFSVYSTIDGKLS